MAGASATGRFRTFLPAAIAALSLLALPRIGPGADAVSPAAALADAPGSATNTAFRRTETRAEEETALLGPRFRVLSSPRFLLVTDTPDEHARWLLGALEETAERYFTVTQRWGVAVRAPGDRLLCVHFANQADFLLYASTRDGVDARWMGGYYASRRNIVALYDDATGDHFVAALRDARSRPHGERRAAALLAEAREATRAKTVHEAIHLLAYNTGLQQVGATYPLWLTEGLAESFARGALSDCGVTAGAAGHAAATLSIAEAGAVISRLSPPRGCADDIDEFYADCRRLFDTLMRHAPVELAAFFDDVARTGDTQASGRQREATVAAMFAARFGSSVGGAEQAARAAEASAYDQPE